MSQGEQPSETTLGLEGQGFAQAGPIEARLRRDIATLAEEIGERHLWRPTALEQARDFVADELIQAGWKVDLQEFQAEGRTVFNVVGEKPGHKPSWVISAHYDSRCGHDRPRGGKRVSGMPGTPGANDNASGVAVLLALARRLGPQPASAGVRLVALVNEEPPFFQTPLMGSWIFAQRCRQRREMLRGVINLDTLGYYTDLPGSQKHYFPYNLWQPSTGNFLAFLSNLRSRRWLQQVHRRFQGLGTLPSIAAAVPLLPGIGWSDDWSFWKAGYRALTVTDTAFLRYPHYHLPEDTPEKLDYPRLALATLGLQEALADLFASPSEGNNESIRAPRG